ncbi:MAG TPA: hypothetical protein VM509_14455 [Planctomycetota bacterium]|nr:hypothetical protein [Planctomycetota bacterium]
MSFQTSDSNAAPELRPVRAAVLKSGMFDEAKTLALELPGWSLVEANETEGRIECSRRGGLLFGSSRITITLEAPPGIPSTTVHVRSESTGGLLSRDRRNVAQFVRPFHRRVCL